MGLLCEQLLPGGPRNGTGKGSMCIAQRAGLGAGRRQLWRQACVSEVSSEPLLPPLTRAESRLPGAARTAQGTARGGSQAWPRATVDRTDKEPQGAPRSEALSPSVRPDPGHAGLREVQHAAPGGSGGAQPALPPPSLSSTCRSLHKGPQDHLRWAIPAEQRAGPPSTQGGTSSHLGCGPHHGAAGRKCWEAAWAWTSEVTQVSVFPAAPHTLPPLSSLPHTRVPPRESSCGHGQSRSKCVGLGHVPVSEAGLCN